MISQIFIAVILTLLTGIVALGIWRKLRDVFLRNNPDMAYLTLRCVCLLHVIPAGYILIQLTARNGFLQTDNLWQMNFKATFLMNLLMLGLIAVWGGVVVKNIIIYRNGEENWRSIQKGNIPEEDEEVLEILEKVKKELKIRKRIHVCQNDMVGSPMLTGIFKSVILLPYRERKYSADELRIIFYHECTHYKSRDIWFKALAVCVGFILPFDIFPESLLTLLDEWSEYDCDRKVLTRLNKRLTPARYFDTIVNAKIEMPEPREEDYIFSMLCEGQLSLERRIEYMKKYKNIKKMAKGVTAVLTCLFVLANVSTAYAAGTGIAGVQQYVYQQTENLHEVYDDPAEKQVQFIPAGEDDTYDRIIYMEDENSEARIMPLLLEEELQDFSWRVSPGVRYVSDEISVTADQKISVTCTATPVSCIYWIGIMDNIGNVWFYSGTGGLSYDFEIPKDGNYRVLVQNRSKQTITAAGNYCYYTVEEETGGTEKTEP